MRAAYPAVLHKMKHMPGVPKPKLKQLIKECVKEMILGDVIQDLAVRLPDQEAIPTPILHDTSNILVRVGDDALFEGETQHRYPMDWCFFEDHAEYLDSELEPITDKRN